jgi:hypothetical protein
MQPSEVVAQRLSEAPLIEQEWATMSYKDRAAWWLSAKWYGYMSTEAYRRGDAPSSANESCRFGEPGFFIATRVPYYEAESVAPAASTEVAVEEPKTDIATPVAPEPVLEQLPAPTEESKPTSIESSEESVRNAIVNGITTNTPLLAAAMKSEPSAVGGGHKKKKKNKNQGGEGKTIQIRLGVTGHQGRS